MPRSARRPRLPTARSAARSPVAQDETCGRIHWMKDPRTVRDQIKSGVRIGLLLVLGIVFVGALLATFSYLAAKDDPAASVSRRLIAGPILAVLAAILSLTTKYWAKWLVGILGLCCVRIFGAIFFGPYLSAPIDRTTALVWFAYLAAALTVTARHVSRKPRGFERLGLVSFVLCLSAASAYGPRKVLFVGLVLLGSSELAQRLLGTAKHHPAALVPGSDT